MKICVQFQVFTPYIPLGSRNTRRNIKKIEKNWKKKFRFRKKKFRLWNRYQWFRPILSADTEFRSDTSPNWPNYQFLFHKMSPSQDFITRTLLTTLDPQEIILDNSCLFHQTWTAWNPCDYRGRNQEWNNFQCFFGPDWCLQFQLWNE